MAQLGEQPDYIAREAYRDPEIVSEYESDRFSGLLGRYRYRREQRGVGGILHLLPDQLSVLDCPCGNGRWWPLLSTHAKSIHGIDVSPAMLDAARRRESAVETRITLALGEAEALPLEDNSVDLVFSHALTKHLPVDTQSRVLCEFGRVTREWVVCSFSLKTPVSGVFWGVRSFIDSHPVTPDELEEMAKTAGLRIESRRRCTTPIGVEFSVLLRKKS